MVSELWLENHTNKEAIGCKTDRNVVISEFYICNALKMKSKVKCIFILSRLNLKKNSMQTLTVAYNDAMSIVCVWQDL